MREILVGLLIVLVCVGCAVHQADNQRVPFEINHSGSGMVNLIMADGTQLTWCAYPDFGCTPFEPTDDLYTHTDGTETIEIGKVMVRYKPKGAE